MYDHSDLPDHAEVIEKVRKLVERQGAADHTIAGSERVSFGKYRCIKGVGGSINVIEFVGQTWLTIALHYEGDRHLSAYHPTKLGRLLIALDKQLVLEHLADV